MIRHQRAGFSLIELMVAMAIAGAIALFAFPRVSGAIARNSLRSAKQQLQSTIVVARAAAIQNGRTARFVRAGNVVRAYVEVSGGTLQPVGAPVDLYADSKVTIETTSNTIRFDPRGFASGVVPSGANTSYQVIRLSRGALTDSVCISPFGRISATGSCL
ncbi:MAG TPA: GspH/FimT family pseudopilin [Gemmatimonadaceae bacterium]|nr:GspH/FimT family pseudopilin [Gemmatimonadaceae bacterium]